MPKKFFTVAVVILSLAIIIALSDFFSSVITVGDFAFLTTQNAKASSYSVYAISLDKSLTESDANTKTTMVKQLNGAGYVYKLDNIYHILASAYENKNDAEKVLEKLNEESKKNAEIIEIKIDKIEMDMNLSSSEKAILSNSINIFKNSYKNLYDISISLDTSVKSETECKLLVNTLKSDIQKIKDDFNTQFSTNLNKKLLEIKLSLSSLEQNLDELCMTSSSFSSQIKHTYLEIIKLNKDLAKELNA